MTININEEFEIFPKTPIVEAVIEIRSTTSSVFNEKSARRLIEKELKSYVYKDNIGEIKIATGKIQPQINKIWEGVRFFSSDKKYIVQFKKNGFVFSRLKPYINWHSFSTEGLRLWELFQSIANPENVNRLGLRFINLIKIPTQNIKLANYLKNTPRSPNLLGFSLAGFMHQDLLAVTDHPYLINIRQTSQKVKTAKRQGIDLILDIDVFTSPELTINSPIERLLNEMRWIKNKVFSESITEKTMELFR